jgi:hypothetical protein
VVALLAEEISELCAQGRVLLGNEDCAHASRPIVRVSLGGLCLSTGTTYRRLAGAGEPQL